MIFPELPRHYYGYNTVHTETPLRGLEETKELSRITVEEWYIKHGLATDPAAAPSRISSKEPIDWFARDAIEFYAVCVIMTAWITVWLGVHRGWW